MSSRPSLFREIVMSRRRHRSRPRRPVNFKVYAIITLACGLLAFLVQLAFDTSSKAKESLDNAAKSMVQDAVKEQVKKEFKGK